MRGYSITLTKELHLDPAPLAFVNDDVSPLQSPERDIHVGK